MYVYIQSERNEWGGLYTVGFYDPDGNWQPESDHTAIEEAVRRVHFLNGGEDDLAERIEKIEAMLGRLRRTAI